MTHTLLKNVWMQVDIFSNNLLGAGILLAKFQLLIPPVF